MRLSSVRSEPMSEPPRTGFDQFQPSAFCWRSGLAVAACRVGWPGLPLEGGLKKKQPQALVNHALIAIKKVAIRQAWQEAVKVTRVFPVF
jgi:hypothetical protein